MDAIPRLLAALRDEKECDAAIESLVAIGLPELPWPYVRLGDPNYEMRCAAAEVLVQLGPNAVDVLCELLRSRNANARALAAETLGRIGDRRAVTPLCAVLSVGDNQLVVVAAEALCRIRDPRASGPLCAVLSRQDAKARSAAIQALLAIGPEVVDSLLDMLSNPREGGWRDAASIVVHFDDPRGIEPLQAALEDPSATIRYVAVEGLARLGAVAAIPDFCRLLNHPDRYTREVAARALRHLSGSHPAPELRQSLAVLDRLARSERALPEAEQLFTSTAEAIRLATDCLAQRPLPAAPPELEAPTLPIPTEASRPEPDRLPIPGSGAGSSGHEPPVLPIRRLPLFRRKG